MFSKRAKYQKGFTLIELLVSISIIIVLSGVVVWNQSEATRKVNLSNAANELLVRLREAQTYGVSVKVTDTGTGETYDAGYGVYLKFDTDHIIFFADKDGDNEYDGTAACQKGAAYECLDKFVLKGGVKIIDMCGRVGASNNEKCSIENGASLDAFSIVYQRPTPATKIKFYHSGGSSPESFKEGAAVIKLGYEVSPASQPPPELCRKINVYETGQITTETSC